MLFISSKGSLQKQRKQMKKCCGQFEMVSDRAIPENFISFVFFSSWISIYLLSDMMMMIIMKPDHAAATYHVFKNYMLIDK